MGARSSARPLDLNLVKVFLAVYDTGSVTLAAERLYMTQPSASYGLARLRDTLGDALFVRTSEGMQPTVFSRALHEDFRKAMVSVDDGVRAARGFNPATSDQRFRVSMSDLGAMMFAPALVAALSVHAPNVELQVVELSVDDVPSQLRSGHIDAAIGNLPSIVRQTASSPLFAETYSCLMRSEHPLARRRPRSITLQQYRAAHHVYINSRSSGHLMVESRLRALGVERKTSLRMQHFTALSSVISSADLVATLPTTVAGQFAKQHPMWIVPLPLKIDPIDMRLHWNPEREGSAALRWFLATAKAVLAKGQMNF